MTTLSDASVLGNTVIVFSQTDEAKPRAAMTLVNDYVQAQYLFKEAVISDPLKPFVFNPDLLVKLPFGQKIINMSWVNNSVLYVEDGKFKSNLQIGKMHKFEGYHPTLDVNVRIPGPLLGKLFEHCILPGVYHKVDLSQLPVRIYGLEGVLCGSYDDSYSVMQMRTDAMFSDKINIQIPRFVADALTSIDLADEESIGIGQNGYQIVFVGRNFSLSCTGLNHDIIELDSAVAEQGAVSVTVDFSPKDLADAIKPLVKLIPAKDTSAAYIVAVFDEGKMSVTMKHSQVGDATSEDITGMDNMYIERGLKSTHANLHPAGFQAYTQLLSTPMATMQVYPKAVLFKCKEVIETTSGKINSVRDYLFPSVEV